MPRSTLWPEVKRQWRLPVEGPLLLSVLVLWTAYLALSELGSLQKIWGMLPAAVLSYGWPILTALAGAAALSGDRNQWPGLSLWRSALGRVAFGYVYATAIAAFLYFTLELIRIWWVSVPDDSSWLLGTWARTDHPELWAGVASVMCLGAGAAAWMTLRVVLAAATLSLILVGSLWAGLWWTLTHLHAYTRVLGSEPVVAGALATAMVWVCAAVVLYARAGDAPTRRRTAWSTAMLITSTLLNATIFGSLVYSILPPLRLEADNVFLMNLEVNTSAGAVLATAVHPEGWSPQVWKVALDGSGGRAFLPRMTYWPQSSPDGQWILYRSERGFLGITHPESVAVRAIRPDGSQDHLVGASGFESAIWRQSKYHPAGPSFWFHESTSHVMIRDRSGQAARFDLEESLDERIPVQTVNERPVTFLGWSADASSVLLAGSTIHDGWCAGDYWERRPWEGVVYVSRWIPPPSRDRRAKIWSESFIGGPSKMLFESDELTSFLSGAAVHNATARFVPMLVSLRASNRSDDNAPEELRVLDLETGDVARLGITSCPCRLSLSADGSKLVYGLCPFSDDEEEDSIELRRRDLKTGNDQILARMSDRRRKLIVSPAGGRVLRQGSPPQVILEDGSVRDDIWEEEWKPVAWIDEHSLLLRSDADDTTSLAVGGLDGSLRMIFP